MKTYIKLNKANWDERAPLHAASKEYALKTFIDDSQYISDVVRFDRQLLGNITGQKGIHLQCHIGTDTISLSRLGAAMTGLDFSAASIAQACLLSEQSGTFAKFIESEVYSAVEATEKNKFDFVYTGIGALCWLPDIDRWAQVVADLLRPGGRLFIREGHPILWALDEKIQDALVVAYPYFEQEKPTVWEDEATYVQTDKKLSSTITHEWNHGIGEIVTALLAHNMELTFLKEHDSVPWEALPGQMACSDDGEWRLIKGKHRLPLTYTLQAVKKD